MQDVASLRARHAHGAASIAGSIVRALDVARRAGDFRYRQASGELSSASVSSGAAMTTLFSAQHCAMRTPSRHRGHGRPGTVHNEVASTNRPQTARKRPRRPANPAL